MPILRSYGWKPDTPDKRDNYWYASKKVIKELPPLVDLRNNMPKIWNQGSLGSCTANATAAQCWFIDKTEPYEPSRLFIYYNTRILEGTVGFDSGASIRNSIKSVIKWGFAPETLWPYIVDNFKKKPTSEAYKKAVKEKVQVYSRVPQHESHLKASIYEGYPVNFGFAVYPSFETDEVAKTGRAVLPGPEEVMLGGHAVLLVGYDDTNKWYIVRNSWGDDWGDRGYFYMPYDYVHDPDLCDDFWIIKAVT